MDFIEGQDQAVAEWASRLLGKPIVQPFAAIGIGQDGLLKAAAIFNDFQGANGNIELTYVGKDSLTRQSLRWLARYAFVINKASRVTMKTRRDNHLVRRLLGSRFTYEGTLSRYYDTTKHGDALVFVLHKNNAERWGAL